jgi:hypothetical protein
VERINNLETVLASTNTDHFGYEFSRIGFYGAEPDYRLTAR